MKAILLLALGACALSAQTVSGVITGSIQDPSDAIVAGAKVDLIHEATGSRRTAETDELGNYTFNSVQPGSYTLAVEHSGFKTFRRTNIVLTANERLPVDIKLEIGGTADTVRIEAQGATVQ